MSEENKGASGATQKPVVEEGKIEQVSRKAYEEVTRDMHKNKQKAKELEMQVNELRSQIQAQEEAKMQEQEQWKELYQKREAELEQFKSEAQKERDRYLVSVKRAALKQELGVGVKDEYLNFASLNEISINEDGSIDRESVREVANHFRKEHGQLIPASENTNITGHAPTSQAPAQPEQVDLRKLTSRERVEYYAKIKAQQS